MENIYNKFRHELGYTNATNQYVELACRKFTAAYNNEIRNDKISIIAKGVGLSLSDLKEDYNLRIAKSYIVSVYTSLDRFLVNFKELQGSPTNVTSKVKKTDESLLEWTLGTINSNMFQPIYNFYYICDYYRLVRNRIVHNGTWDNEIKQRYSSIKNQQQFNLNAPNTIDALTFDDQVLLSRSANNLVKNLYLFAKYDINTIAEKYHSQLYKLFHGDNNKIKAQKKISKFLEAYYPKFNDDNLDKIIQLIKQKKS